MRLTFNYDELKANKITTEKITELIEAIGFSAELLEEIIDDRKLYLRNRDDDVDLECLNEQNN